MKKLVLILGLILLPAFVEPQSDVYSQQTSVEKGPPSTTFAFDAFGRPRISTFVTLFDSKQCFQQETNYFNITTTGTATSVTWDNTGYVSNTLTSGTTATSLAGMETKQYFPYQPGKSHLIFMTGNFMGTATNVVKRMGYFDEFNGIFVQVSGTALSIVLRATFGGVTTDTVVPQSAWYDHMDGTGPGFGNPSNYNIDLTKSQYIAIDFAWLGVGPLRVGFLTPSGIRVAHYFTNINVRTGVYMGKPNLPVRWEIRNNGSTTGSRMSAICTSVMTEGPLPISFPRYTVQNIAGVSPVNSSWVGLVAIRLNSTFNRGVSFHPARWWMATNSGSTYGAAGVFYNPQINSNTGSWVSGGNGSMVQYNTTFTGLVTVTNTSCVEVDGNGQFNGNNVISNPGSFEPFLLGGFDWNQTTSDIYVLAYDGISGAGNVFGGLIWDELR